MTGEVRKSAPINLGETVRTLRIHAEADGAGFGVSFLLHALAILLLFYFAHRALPSQTQRDHFVPVSLIAQSEGPSPESRQARAAGAVAKTPLLRPRAALAHRTPSAVAPEKTREPVDALQMQLRALSKLRQPNTDTRLAGDAGNSLEAESGTDESPGGEGAYAARDIIRAQILRRWSLDMTRLGGRNFDILLHVTLRRDGTVLDADIVDQGRFKTDSVFRWIAQSAKNAVLLSSPLTLPPGIEERRFEFTLTLNPRDAIQ